MLAFSLAGTSVITGAVLTEKAGGFTITAVSLAVMLLCLSPFYGAKIIQTIRSLKWVDWKMLILQAVFGIFLFRIFLLWGISMTSTVEAGILTGTTPAVTSILAFLVLREKSTGWTALGIACTVIGIALLQGAGPHSIEFTQRHLAGNGLILCAAASESAFNIISRKHKAERQQAMAAQMHPVVQTCLVSAVAFLLSVLPALLEHPFTALRTMGVREWFALLWYGLVVTALAFVFFYKGVKHCDAYTTAAFSGMIPLTSMLLSLLFLKEKIEWVQWAGGLLIIFSILLIAGKQRAPGHR